MRSRALALAFLFSVSLTACRAEVPDSAGRAAESGLEQVPLEIRSAGRVHRFTVEVARSEEEQARGMMFRQSLAPDRGMIFPFPSPRPASFWMKNTFIPLDMIFVRSDGSIARIADNIVPESLEPVEVGEPVASVLELAGGRAAELGITESDTISWTDRPKP